MALRSTQPLTEKSTRNLPGGKGRPARKADILIESVEPRPLTTLWITSAFYRDTFTLPFYTQSVGLLGRGISRRKAANYTQKKGGSGRRDGIRTSFKSGLTPP
jgi:hypothetical protein